MTLDRAFLSQTAATLSANRDPESILNEVVSALARGPEIALARIWLIRPGDLCATCHHRESCSERTRCLHLVASDGRSTSTPELRWSGVDGQFRRIPMIADKIGRIVTTGEAVNEPRVNEASNRFRHPEWARAEKILGFSGQPLIFAGRILGALCVFNRVTLSEEDMAFLRIFANHAAAALANAEAFEEITRLQNALALENEYLRHEIRVVQGEPVDFETAPSMRRVREQIDVIASTSAPVLILGESGTGKELAATRIHERSERNDAPMVRVNCASVPRDLFESEFFGHVAGAFTGASLSRVGRFKLADGGTLFLDEVAEIPLELQAKLLRVLQEGTFEQVGSDVTTTVSVRIIAATNRDLAREVRENRFREDLYYRLSVFPIQLPPLRERREDIPALARHFLEQACRNLGIGTCSLSRDDLNRLAAYDWPGNIRELRNIIDRAAILAQRGPLRIDVPAEPPRMQEPVTHIPGAEPVGVNSYNDIEHIERDLIHRTLSACRGRVSGSGGAAEILNVKATTLRYRIQSFGLDPRSYRR